MKILKNGEKINYIYAKLEWYNPTGSIKDRVAYYMIKKAKERGILKENMIYIAMEEDTKKRNEMSDKLEKIILKYLVPVREKRKFNRNKNIKNKYHINKRKSF